jgi:PKD repeat protein
VTVEGGASYTDAGASATDIVDGDLTASIVVGGLPINTSVLGTHTVTYNVTDSSGNAAAQATRTVNVVDTTTPVVTPPADVTVDQTGDLTPVTLGAATAADNVAIASITNDGPASFPLGTTVVTWTATDTSGNVSSATQQVTVNPVPLVQLQILKDFLSSLALNSGLYKKLNKKLNEAEIAIISGNNAGAIKALNSFINTVQSNTPQNIAQADADEMIQRAQAIIALL